MTPKKLNSMNKSSMETASPFHSRSSHTSLCEQLRQESRSNQPM
uniref:Uncharacterized protein n=1 Tax=Rhizophora mucronata TaxID=61149 RepID=A0A2P2PE89_RHIMU